MYEDECLGGIYGTCKWGQSEILFMFKCVRGEMDKDQMELVDL